MSKFFRAHARCLTCVQTASHSELSNRGRTTGMADGETDSFSCARMCAIVRAKRLSPRKFFSMRAILARSVVPPGLDFCDSENVHFFVRACALARAHS